MGNNLCSCAQPQHNDRGKPKPRQSDIHKDARGSSMVSSMVSNDDYKDLPVGKQMSIPASAQRSNQLKNQDGSIVGSTNSRLLSPTKGPSLLLNRLSQNRKESALGMSLTQRTEQAQNKALMDIELNPNKQSWDINPLNDKDNSISYSFFYMNGSLITQQEESEEVLIHSNILRAFMNTDLQKGTQDQVQALKENQIIIKAVDQEKVDQIDDIIKFMNANSKSFKGIKALERIGETLNCVIYSIKSIVNEDLVLKVPKVAQQNSFNDLIFESQLVKTLQQNRNGSIANIKEEIFQIDPKLKRIYNYVVVMERPLNLLVDFMVTETIQTQQPDINMYTSQQIFSQEKYLYLVYEGIKLLEFLQSQGVYYGQFSPLQMTISNDYSLKIVDFMLSIVGHPEQNQTLHYLKGINIKMSSNEMKNIYTDMITKDGKSKYFAKQWTLAQLFNEDRNSLINSFLMPQLESKIQNQEILALIIEQLGVMQNDQQVQLHEIIEKFENFFNMNISTIQQLINQFEQEQMKEAVQKVGELLIKVGVKFDNKMAQAQGSVIQGELLLSQKRYEEAKAVLSDAIEIQEQYPKSLDNIYHSRAFRALAMLEREKGNIQESLEYLELTFDLSTDKTQLLKYYQEFSKTLMEQHKYNQALDCNLKALQLSQELKGEEDYTTLECYITLADNYEKLGQIEDSEATFQRCIKIFETKNDVDGNGNASFERPSIIHRLAISMRLKQEYEMAADLLEKVIKIKTKILGTELHPDMALLYNDLALAYQGLELFEDAIEFIEKNIQILKQQGQSKINDLISAYQFLAELNREIENFDEAVQAQQSAVELEIELNQGIPTIDCAVTYKQIAEDLLKVEEIEQGIEYLEKALQIETEFYGSIKDMQVQETSIFLAQAYQYAQKFDESTKLATQIAELREQQGVDSQLLLPVYRLLSINYQNTQQYDEAIDNLKKIIQLQTELAGGSDQQPLIVSLYTKMAGNYRLKGDMQNAIAYSVKVYELMRKMSGKSNEQTNMAFKNVGIMYLENKDYDKALVIFQKCLKRLEEIFGSDYAHIQNEYSSVEELIERVNHEQKGTETV